MPGFLQDSIAVLLRMVLRVNVLAYNTPPQSLTTTLDPDTRTAYLHCVDNDSDIAISRLNEGSQDFEYWMSSEDFQLLSAGHTGRYAWSVVYAADKSEGFDEYVNGLAELFKMEREKMFQQVGVGILNILKELNWYLLLIL